ncbi:MAG TPA: heme-binding protein [Burkholderiales bacterium]|nr:heme-binding protein [Burkholderiales bacterium]
MRPAFKLELSEARAMVLAALAKAEAIGVLETVCIVDDGGYPLALERMDGARITGPQIAWNKAFTAAGHKRSTHLFTTPPNGPALPGNEAFGIQWSFEGRFAAFVGGFPVVVDGEVVGGVGLSGGNGEQDTQCGLAALQALKNLLAPHKRAVLVEADIKK